MTFLSTLRHRVVYTLVPASIGAALGYGYARFTLSPELLGHSSQPGMYAAVGSIIVLLCVRLGSLARMILEDYLKKR